MYVNREEIGREYQYEGTTDPIVRNLRSRFSLAETPVTEKPGGEAAPRRNGT